MLWSSWHNHTGDGVRYSYCASRDLTLACYRRALCEGPWQSFAITEHAFALAIPEDAEPWPHQWYHQPSRLWDYREFREHKTRQYLARLARECDGEHIFGGLEVEVDCDGSLIMEERLRPFFDVLIGSIHYLPGAQSHWYAQHIAHVEMLLRYPLDILGHPFRLISSIGPVPDEIIDETLLRAKQAGVAIEINAHMPCEDDAKLLARAVQLDLPIAFSLDAHHRDELALYTYFEQVVAASGVNCDDIRFFHPAQRTANAQLSVR